MKQYKGNGKGRSKDKSGSKGKSKGKQKGKGAQKGKGKLKGAKASSEGPKGKGKSEPTHVANPGTLLEIVGSLHKSETWLQTWRKDLRFKDPHHPHTPATQYKVARIVEVSEDVQQHDELIFDMRRCSNAEVFMEA